MNTPSSVLLLLSALLLAGCYSVEQSNVERGYRFIRRRDTKRALSTFDRTISKNPHSVLAHIGRADTLFEAHRDAEAVAAFSEAIRLSSEQPVTAKTERRGEAEVVGERFLSYQNQGLRFPFGVEAYLYVRRAGAYGGLAMSDSRVVDPVSYRNALADYDRAIELAPDYTAAHTARERFLKAGKEASPPPSDNGAGAAPASPPGS